MKVTIKAKGNKDNRNCREWTDVNSFLNDIAFWFCSGNEVANEVKFFEGVIYGLIWSTSCKAEFVRSGLIFTITAEE